MTSYRFIGTGVTDSSGVARLTKDPQGQTISGYTGSGVGEVDFVASLDNPIESGSIVSETYGVLDCFWIDTGTATGHKTSWYNYNNILTVDYPSQYNATRVRKTEEGTTQRYYYYNDSVISTEKIGGINTITTPSCIEFDVLSIVGTIQLSVTDNNSNARLPEITAKGHYKLVLDGSTLVIYKNGEQQGNPLVVDGDYYRFGFGFNAQNEGIVFKDFMIYPI